MPEREYRHPVGCDIIEANGSVTPVSLDTLFVPRNGTAHDSKRSEQRFRDRPRRHEGSA